MCFVFYLGIMKSMLFIRMFDTLSIYDVGAGFFYVEITGEQKSAPQKMKKKNENTALCELNKWIRVFR